MEIFRKWREVKINCILWYDTTTVTIKVSSQPYPHVDHPNRQQDTFTHSRRCRLAVLLETITKQMTVVCEIYSDRITCKQFWKWKKPNKTYDAHFKYEEAPVGIIKRNMCFSSYQLMLSCHFMLGCGFSFCFPKKRCIMGEKEGKEKLD